MLPNYIDPEAYAAWVEQRKEHKAPFTPRAEKLLITKLMRHHGEGWDVNEALEQATISGWKSVYPRVMRMIDAQGRSKAEQDFGKAQIDASISKMCASAVRRV